MYNDDVGILRWKGVQILHEPVTVLGVYRLESHWPPAGKARRFEQTLSQETPVYR